ARHAHFAALLEVLELALADHPAHGFLHVRLVPPKETLAVDAALAAIVETTVDQVGHISNWPCGRAGTTRQAGAPASPCSPSAPCGRRSSDASPCRPRRPWH